MKAEVETLRAELALREAEDWVAEGEERRVERELVTTLADVEKLRNPDGCEGDITSCDQRLSRCRIQSLHARDSVVNLTRRIQCDGEVRRDSQCRLQSFQGFVNPS